MAWMQRLRKNKSLQYGLPMMILEGLIDKSMCVLIVGGSFGLREFAQIRYDIQKIRGKIDPELEKKLKKSKVTLEEEYEKIKNTSFDDWKNVRGPRPWEETGSDQKKQQ